MTSLLDRSCPSTAGDPSGPGLGELNCGTDGASAPQQRLRVARFGTAGPGNTDVLARVPLAGPREETTMRYLSKPQLAMMVIAVLYLVSPVDLVPEIVLGPLGLTDDAAAFTAIITTLMLARARAKEQSQQIPGETLPATPGVEAAFVP